jgi:hypothetical protein
VQGALVFGKKSEKKRQKAGFSVFCRAMLILVRSFLLQIRLCAILKSL